jgi:hypothetical protein
MLFDERFRVSLSLSLSLLCGLFVVYYYYSVSTLFSFYLFSFSSFPFSCCPEVFKTLFVRPVNISNAHTSKKIEWGEMKGEISLPKRRRDVRTIQNWAKMTCPEIKKLNKI